MTADDGVTGEAIPDLIENLKPAQLDALEALLAGATDKAAAEAAGVDRTTVSRWKNRDPNFKAAYNAARLKRAERIQNRLWSRIDELVDTVLKAALDDGDARMALQLLERLGAFQEVRPEDKITDPEVIRVEQVLRAWQLSNIKEGRQSLEEKPNDEIFEAIEVEREHADDSSEMTKKLAAVRKHLEDRGWDLSGEFPKRIESGDETEQGVGEA